MNTTRPVIPPLAWWGMVAFMVMVFFFGIHTNGVTTPEKNKKHYAIIAKPDAWLNVAWAKNLSAKPLVIVMGSSLLGRSLEPATSPDSPYQTLVLYKPGGTYDHFDDFFQTPLPKQTSLIIIHSDFFITRNDTVNTHYFIKQTRLLISQLLRGNTSKRIPTTFHCGPLTEAHRHKWRTLFSRFYSHPPERQYGLVQWIQQQQQEGRKVVLLDIPRSPSAERSLGQTLIQWRSGLEHMSTTLKIATIKYPGTLSDSEFCDEHHMKQVAGAKHSQWLNHTIGTLLREPA